MRRAKYLLFLLVLTAAVLGLAAVASAAVFSDIEGKASAGAIMKLNALGIVDGYPDGTFKPDKTITRAEFCKFAVIAAGLKDVAAGYEQVPSPFSDVATGAWYTGWVNIAAAQGYVKGYPDGTFKPDAQITQQEVITVLLRLLGYNDNLPGEWPFDYLAKAAKLGVTDNITVRAAMPATRGEVALLTDAVLDENVVEYDAEKNVFTEKLVNNAPVTLLGESFKEGTVIEDALVTNLDVSDNKVRIVYVTWDANGNLSGEQKLELYPKGYSVYGVAAYPALIDRVVDIVTIKEDDDTYARYVEAKAYGVVTDDEAKITVSGGKPTKIEINDKSYDVVANPSLSLISFAGVPTDKTYTYDLDAHLFKLTLNKDGDVCRIKAVNWGQAAVVDSVDEARKVVWFKEKGTPVKSMYYDTTSNSWATKDTTLVFDSTKIDLSDKEGDYFVLKNGKPATLADLKENDLVYNYKRGVTYYFDAMDKKVEGTLTSYTMDGARMKKIVVGDKEYSLAPNPLYSTDGGDDFSTLTATAVEDDLMDQAVTVYLNPAGKAQLVISSAEAEGNKVYGILTETVHNAATPSGLKDYVTVLKPDGTEATYEVDKDSSNNAKALMTTLGSATNVDRFVELTVRSNGAVDDFTDLSGPATPTPYARYAARDVESGRIGIDVNGNGALESGEWFTVSDKIGVFNLTNPDVDEYAGVEQYSDVFDYIDDARRPVLNVWYYSKDNNNIIDYLVLADGSSIGGGDFWIVLKRGKDSDGTYLVLDRNGTQKTLHVVGTPTVQKLTVSQGVYVYDVGSAQFTSPPGYGIDNINKFDVVRFTTSGTKINTIAEWFPNSGDLTVGGATYGLVTDRDTGGNRIQVGSAWYTVDSDTIIYDVDEDNPVALRLADVGKGDKVVLGVDKGLVKWMVVWGN